MEDKREKFVRLANQRVNKALDQLRLVGNLGNRSAYDYTEDDAKKIVKALQKSLDEAKGKLLGDTDGSSHTFSL